MSLIPTTLPNPSVDAVIPIIFNSILSENSNRDITLIDPINPLTSDVILTTTTTTTTTTTNMPATSTPISIDILKICESNCDKLGY